MRRHAREHEARPRRRCAPEDRLRTPRAVAVRGVAVRAPHIDEDSRRQIRVGPVEHPVAHLLDGGVVDRLHLQRVDAEGVQDRDRPSTERERGTGGQGDVPCSIDGQGPAPERRLEHVIPLGQRHRQCDHIVGIRTVHRRGHARDAVGNLFNRSGVLRLDVERERISGKHGYEDPNKYNRLHHLNPLCCFDQCLREPPGSGALPPNS